MSLGVSPQDTKRVAAPDTVCCKLSAAAGGPRNDLWVILSYVCAICNTLCDVGALLNP